jgi:hypothetical protein
MIDMNSFEKRQIKFDLYLDSYGTDTIEMEFLIFISAIFMTLVANPHFKATYSAKSYALGYITLNLIQSDPVVLK